MKTYTFTYYVMNDEGKCVCRDFPVRSSRFTQAFYCFSRFFNAIVSPYDFRDYSATYKVTTPKSSCYRVLPDKYASSLRRCVAEV